MTRFELLFGIRDSQVKKNCILMPLLAKGVLKDFAVEKLVRGKLYGLGNSKDFTLIHTGIGAGFVGDVVLYLRDTPCKNIILFGSCGLAAAKGLYIGSLVSPFKCYSNESFSSTLSGRSQKAKVFYPDKKLFEGFLKAGKKAGIREVTCSTISSLKLEEERLNSIIKKGIDVVDMECSAFFAASKYADLKAVALFYVSDIIKSRPFYISLDSAQKSVLAFAIKKATSYLCDFLKRNLNV